MPQGRSQCAWTTLRGSSRYRNMDVPPSMGPTPPTYHRGRRWVAGVFVGAAVVWTCLRHRPFGVKVEGMSMAPTLLPGDWAIAVPIRRIRRGDVVVVEHTDRHGYEMVKRVAGVPGDVIGASDPGGSATSRLLARNEFWLEGDHRAGSTDSRD